MVKLTTVDLSYKPKHVEALIEENDTQAARITELEAALRDLLKHDDERFGFEGEPSDVEKRCRAVLGKRD